jgi:hypothetical protein
VRRFLENPYMQYFCGNEYFEHKLPCHPTWLVRWRKYIGSAGAEQMLGRRSTWPNVLRSSPKLSSLRSI